MDRPIVYTQEQGRSTDFLFASRAAMIGLGNLAQAVLGTNTIIEGLAVTPTAPASLAVQVGSGQIYSFQPVDATAYGVLPADTTDSIVKQGLLMQATTLNTPAPTTSGYSINYLIEATYQDSDTNPVVLPYFNSANPSQPLSGQNNSGAAQPTERQGLCVVQVKAGTAATTGTQTTPAVDAGYTALAVVTVAYGQASVTGSNITPVAGAPVISNLLTMMQTASSINGKDVGSANAYAMNLQPAISAYTPGMIVSLESINATNTGPSTLSINGLTSLPIYGPAATVLQGGELAAGYGALLRVNAAATAFELIQTTGGSLPVKTATATNHALNYGQAGGLFAPIAGNPSQTFAVASATQNNQAVNLGQINGLFAPIAGNASQTFAVANATTTTQAVNLGQFTTLSNSSGYTQFPNGFIVQWGSGNTTGSNPATANIAFPIAFPNKIFSLQALGNAGNSSIPAAMGSGSYSVTGATITSNGTTPFFYITIGY
jgi:hypothetical protein